MLCKDCILKKCDHTTVTRCLTLHHEPQYAFTVKEVNMVVVTQRRESTWMERATRGNPRRSRQAHLRAEDQEPNTKR